MESCLVQQYQDYRRISSDIQSDVLEMVPGAAMNEFGRRLGALWHGRVALEDRNDLKLLYDIAIHTARPGRTRAIDRYALKTKFPDGSADARMLHGLRTSYFTMFEFRRRHRIAGAVAWDVLRRREFHLMDLSMGLSAEEGAVYVGRLMDIDDYSMSCLIVLPINMALVEQASPHLPQTRDRVDFAYFQDPRCSTGFYRAAIESGVTTRCVNVDVARELPTEATVASMLAVTGHRLADWPALPAAR